MVKGKSSSAAFGRVAAISGQDAQSFAAGRSNVGGNSWFGQVKATQELAKDLFEAINNNVVYAP